ARMTQMLRMNRCRFKRARGRRSGTLPWSRAMQIVSCYEAPERARRRSNITTASKDAIPFLSAAELLARYRRKELSPVEVMRAVLDRIDRHNGAVNAWCHLDAEGALRSAKDSEARWLAGTPKGLADGVPVGIKDNILVAGMPARFGSRLTSSDPAPHD